MKIPSSTTIISTIDWSYEIDRKDCFMVLDKLYSKGFRKLECSAIYPICGNSDFFRITEEHIQDWVKSNGIHDLEIYAHIGEMSNKPNNKEFNFSGSFLRMLVDDYFYKFGDNLKCLIIPSLAKHTEDHFIQTIDVLTDYEKVKIGLNPYINDLHEQEIINQYGISINAFINSNYLENTLIQSDCSISNLYLDFRFYNKTAISDHAAYLAQIIRQFETFKIDCHLPVNQGIMIPIDGIVLLNALISFSELGHAA